MMPRSPSAIAIAVALACAGGWVRPPAAHAAPAASPLQRAEAHLAAGEHRQAADALVEAYDGLPADLRAGETGEFLAMRAADAYGRAHGSDGDVQHLQASRTLLNRFVADATRTGIAADDPLLSRARTEIERIDGVLAAAATSEPEPEPGPEPEPEPTPAPEREPAPVVPPPDDPRPAARPTVDAPPERDRDAIGLGLVIGGSIATAGGIAMLVAGPLYRRAAEDLIDDRGGTTEGDTAYLDGARTVQTALVVSGAVLAALGIAGLSWGAVRLARGRGRTTALVQPRWTAGIGTLGVGATLRW